MHVRAIVTTCACVAAASIVRADVVLGDSTFAPSNWAMETILVGSGGGSAAGSQSSTGNPGTARRVTLTTGPSVGDGVYGFSRYGTTQATRYVPATQGAIASIDWTIDARFVTGTFFGAGQAIMLGLKQGQTVYFADDDVTGSGGQWNTFGAVGLLASDFARVDGVAGTPDFGMTGEPIRVGFISANSNGGSPYSTTVDFDNFSVTIRVPAPAGLLAFGLGGAMLRRRRRVSAKH